MREGGKKEAGKLVPGSPRFDICNGRSSLMWKLSWSQPKPQIKQTCDWALKGETSVSIIDFCCCWMREGGKKEAGKLVPSCPRFDIRNGRGSLRWKLSSSWKYPVVMAHFWMACHSKHTQLEFICWHQYKLGLTKILQYISHQICLRNFEFPMDFANFFPPFFQQFVTNWLQSTSWIARHDPRKQYFSHHLGFDCYSRGPTH